MTGSKLFEELCASTDLPNQMLETEMRALLNAHKIDEANLTLDQVRDVVADYLQDILVELKKELDNF